MQESKQEATKVVYLANNGVNATKCIHVGRLGKCSQTGIIISGVRIPLEKQPTTVLSSCSVSCTSKGSTVL